ncbi:MAG: 30S ribosomal protein S9 [Myxococcota bacterium]|nr:30S ribosomal protein S9 [Myxococcota bacterium]MEC9390398.1 30S ribosomal protein S9 [Myxococcota bacterium]
MSITQYYGTGRRKTSVARVYLRPGKGEIVVNRTPIEDYFNRESVKQVLKQPLALTGTLDDFDILINVQGGGKNGQAGAVRLGIARALCEANPENRAVLKSNGLLTRDARKVERKKYGQPGARKKFQFSKR